MANGIDRSVAAERVALRSQVTLAYAVRAAVPPLLFSFRLWASVCLALFVAFSLELDNPYWAGISAAIVCQPNLGASLRKSRYRIVGTLVGATMIVMLTAWFPQNRIGFLVGLALWGGACAFAASLFRNFTSYAAALAGYTAAIIGTDTLGATGGASGEVFMLAVTRASEIWIGILCAGAILALTDFGGAAERLAQKLTAVSTEIAAGFVATLRLAGSDSADAQQPARRELIRQVFDRSPGLTRRSTRRSENPQQFAITRPFCRALSTGCLPRSLPGAVLQRGSSKFRLRLLTRKPMRFWAAFQKKCVPRCQQARRRSG
jgi:uncharacterized membrane protein YccC